MACEGCKRRREAMLKAWRELKEKARKRWEEKHK